ncbi:MAG: hypothetical protein WKF48_08805 [Solirubrobacteraceae bacterium]
MTLRCVRLMLVMGAMLLVACGGGSDEPEDDGPTRQSYIAEVDALCRRVTLDSRERNRELQALVDGSGSFAGRLRKGAPLLSETYDVQKAKLDRFKRIEPPADDRAQISRVTTAAEATLMQLRDAVSIAQRGDLKSFIDVIFDATGARAKVERLGTTYGFRADCFSVPIDLQ